MSNAPEMMDVLLANGADLLQKDKKGRDVIQIVLYPTEDAFSGRVHSAEPDKIRVLMKHLPYTSPRLVTCLVVLHQGKVGPAVAVVLVLLVLYVLSFKCKGSSLPDVDLLGPAPAVDDDASSAPAAQSGARPSASPARARPPPTQAAKKKELVFEDVMEKAAAGCGGVMGFWLFTIFFNLLVGLFTLGLGSLALVVLDLICICSNGSTFAGLLFGIQLLNARTLRPAGFCDFLMMYFLNWLLNACTLGLAIFFFILPCGCCSSGYQSCSDKLLGVVWVNKSAFREYVMVARIRRASSGGGGSAAPSASTSPAPPATKPPKKEPVVEKEEVAAPARPASTGKNKSPARAKAKKA